MADIWASPTTAGVAANTWPTSLVWALSLADTGPERSFDQHTQHCAAIFGPSTGQIGVLKALAASSGVLQRLVFLKFGNGGDVAVLFAAEATDQRTGPSGTHPVLM